MYALLSLLAIAFSLVAQCVAWVPVEYSQPMKVKGTGNFKTWYELDSVADSEYDDDIPWSKLLEIANTHFNWVRHQPGAFTGTGNARSCLVAALFVPGGKLGSKVWVSTIARGQPTDAQSMYGEMMTRGSQYAPGWFGAKSGNGNHAEDSVLFSFESHTMMYWDATRREYQNSQEQKPNLKMATYGIRSGSMDAEGGPVDLCGLCVTTATRLGIDYFDTTASTKKKRDDAMDEEELMMMVAPQQVEKEKVRRLPKKKTTPKKTTSSKKPTPKSTASSSTKAAVPTPSSKASSSTPSAAAAAAATSSSSSKPSVAIHPASSPQSSQPAGGGASSSTFGTSSSSSSSSSGQMTPTPTPASSSSSSSSSSSMTSAASGATTSSSQSTKQVLPSIAPVAFTFSLSDQPGYDTPGAVVPEAQQGGSSQAKATPAAAGGGGQTAQTGAAAAAGGAVQPTARAALLRPRHRRRLPQRVAVA